MSGDAAKTVAVIGTQGKAVFLDGDYAANVAHCDAINCISFDKDTGFDHFRGEDMPTHIMDAFRQGAAKDDTLNGKFAKIVVLPEDSVRLCSEIHVSPNGDVTLLSDKDWVAPVLL